MLLIDTHCHLNFTPLVTQLTAVVARAKERGVKKIIVPAYDSASFGPITNLCDHQALYPAIGIHPWVADKPSSRDALIHYLTSANAVAVGEIGLDFKVEVDRRRQRDVLDMQLEIATALRLPVILHVRGAYDEMLSTVKRRGTTLTGVIHAFSRGPELAKRFVDLGFLIAFGGAITHPRATRARRAAKAIDLENIVLETDAPSIGLDGVLSIDVEPAHVADVAAALAEIRGESIETIAEVTSRNAERLFQLQTS